MDRGDESEIWLNFMPDESWDRLREIAIGKAREIVGPAQAEDVAQATLAAYGLAIDIIDNPEAWVTSVAKNLSINTVKQRGREILVEPSDLQGSGDGRGNSKPDQIDLLVGKILFEEMLSRLPEKQRTVLELQYGLGLQRAQIADLLKVTVETVKEHRERGIRHLRQAMRRDQENADDEG